MSESSTETSLFGGTKADFNLPKIAFSSNKSQDFGREVTLNLKNNSSKKMPTINGTPVKTSKNNYSKDTPIKQKNCRLESVQANCGNSSNETNCSKSKTIDKNKTNANIALNFNFSLKVDEGEDSKKNIPLKTSGSSKNSDNILEDTALEMETPSSIKVAVRMRPLLNSEKDKIKSKDGKITDILIKDQKVLIPHKKEVFEFDYCFDSSNQESFHFVSQEETYRRMGEPLLDYSFQGYNVCLFAYGQSGSGKTYTMVGTEENPGIVPRFINNLFRRINRTDGVEFIVNISCLEIYNEKIRDLLSDEFDILTKKLRVREHPQTGPYVDDLTVYTVEDSENAMELVQKGLSRRTMASTSSNETSSRSHTIFTIILVQNKKFDDGSDSTTETSRISKINLVDLAGSERVASSNADSFREGTMINKSLLTLGKVITQLAENNGGGHVPYRDSILTYLLKDSLGGNSRTSMIATISPAKCHLEETISTLRYAAKAQKIINIVRVNEDPKMKIINGLLKQISFLKKEVNRNDKGSSNLLAQKASEVVDKGEECACESAFDSLSDLKVKIDNTLKLQEKITDEIEDLKRNSSIIFDRSNNSDNVEKFRHKILDHLKLVLKSSEEFDLSQFQLDSSNFEFDLDHEETSIKEPNTIEEKESFVKSDSSIISSFKKEKTTELENTKTQTNLKQHMTKNEQKRLKNKESFDQQPGLEDQQKEENEPKPDKSIDQTTEPKPAIEVSLDNTAEFQDAHEKLEVKDDDEGNSDSDDNQRRGKRGKKGKAKGKGKNKKGK